ncbi:hypothetical protein MKX03_011995, partial [Papaver bracteatum]
MFEFSAVTTVNCSSPAMLNNNDNKENLNDQNLSLRIQKRGGYNLRKSLSWNKAYFIDECIKVQLTKAPSGSVLLNSSTLNRIIKDSRIPKPNIVKAVNLSKHNHLSTDLRSPRSVKGTNIGQKTTPHL